jgi:hypothetical protein
MQAAADLIGATAEAKGEVEIFKAALGADASSDGADGMKNGL